MPRPEDEAYDKKLYADIEREMKNKSPRQQAEFMVDLFMLHQNADGAQHKAIDMFKQEFFFPQNEDGKLDRKLFEERLDQAQRVITERVLIQQGKFSVDHPQNSKNWIWHQATSGMPAGAWKCAFEIAFFATLNENQVDWLLQEAYKKEYPGKSGSMIWINLSEAKKEQIYRNYAEESPKMEEIITEGRRYIGNSDQVYDNMTEEEKKQQKLLEQQETFMKSREEQLQAAKAGYEAFLELDLGYINPKSRKALQESMIRQKKTEFGDENWKPEQMRLGKFKSELLAQTDNMMEQLKLNSGYRITNSKEFNDLLDDMKKFRTCLKDYDSTKNWSELRKTLEQFQKDCKTYQMKDGGPKRIPKTPSGKRRLSLTFDMSAMAESALRRMAEVDRKGPKRMMDTTNSISKFKTNITELSGGSNNIRMNHNTVQKGKENSKTISLK